MDTRRDGFVKSMTLNCLTRVMVRRPIAPQASTDG
jgi:hypothetical protein